jgi:hypothetical protein
MFARWKARIGGVQADINMMLNGMTAFSITSGIMSFLGAPWWGIGALLTVVVAAFLSYAYLYNEGGVRNQVQRDNQDLASNYSRPVMRIDDEMIARTVLAGLKGRELSEDERQAIKTEADETFVEYNDGLDLSAYGR